ncbi:MAG: LysM peptidoglycan-binding domain-containing protein [Burkholderiales bacterium]|nr:LysM peptidoglycan-binding domain-containing protein [Burkholderiales bacterium]
MSPSDRSGLRGQERRAVLALGVAAALGPVWMRSASAAPGDYPITPEQRAAATQVAQAGVPLSDLAANAPDRHVVRRGDTLWDISKIFLKSPWRWPQLWGMNLDQIRNPHLIYPGQVLVLVKSGGRAMLTLGQDLSGPGGTVKLSPQVRAELLPNGAIAAIPLHLIGPFLNEAVVFDTDALERAPRIVATQENRVIVSRGETAYVRGDLGGARDFRLFRQPRPLLDPETREVLGFEATYVGAAEFVRDGGLLPSADGKTATVVPATFMITDTRLEAGVGDRLSPVPPSELAAYAPHPPSSSVDGRIVSVYGEAVLAGQNQIVALNRGARDGIERGHVLALWRAGRMAADRTDGKRTPMRLPDERHGLLFVFRVFERVAYALVVSVQEPVGTGDRFTQP